MSGLIIAYLFHPQTNVVDRLQWENDSLRYVIKHKPYLLPEDIKVDSIKLWV